MTPDIFKNAVKVYEDVHDLVSFNGSDTRTCRTSIGLDKGGDFCLKVKMHFDLSIPKEISGYHEMIKIAKLQTEFPITSQLTVKENYAQNIPPHNIAQMSAGDSPGRLAAIRYVQCARTVVVYP